MPVVHYAFGRLHRYTSYRSLIMASAMKSTNKFIMSDYLKYVCLVMLIIQSTTLILWMRYIRTTPGDMFISTTVVVCAEAAKCLVSLLIILLKQRSICQLFRRLRENVFPYPRDSVTFAVLSLLHTLGNNLQSLAISNLDPATYQVCYQLNVVTTALLSALVLNKKLSHVQWLSFCILFAGFVCVQFQLSEATADAAMGQMYWHRCNIGTTAVAVLCMVSSIAQVYERISKGRTLSVWVRNFQMGFIGSLIGLVIIWVHDGAQVREKGFFFGYTWAVWLAVALQSFGGLLVAVVVKHVGNSPNGFVTSAVIVLSCVASMEFLDFHLSATFAIGATLVIVAVYLYSREEVSSRRQEQNSTSTDGVLPMWHSTFDECHNQTQLDSSQYKNAVALPD